jgi:hypothetical protein
MCSTGVRVGGVELQPWRPHQFRVKEFPDVVISFTVEGGRVVAMRQRLTPATGTGGETA